MTEKGLAQAKVKSSSQVLLIALLLGLLVACESLTYYTQAVRGQLYILNHRQDIQKLIDDVATPTDLRVKLQTVLDARAFADTYLSLPLKNNYDSYVDLERPYVVWNVFAADEFSMQPETWCYPIAGCVSYRGYFSEQQARDFALELTEQGLDAYVGGVAAYSTLGWFADPVLNTVLARDDHQLASLIFHELAHQQVYVAGDTDFNESFATAVEREGLRRWLQASYDDEASALILHSALVEFERREEFVALIQTTVELLEGLYATDLSEEAKRQQKSHYLTMLREQYETLKHERWEGYAGYDAWFNRPLNNAQLNTVATYYRWVEAFERILQEQGSDLPLFYQEVERIGRLPTDERIELLTLKSSSRATTSL